jgi:hypothetical protein
MTRFQIRADQSQPANLKVLLRNKLNSKSILAKKKDLTSQLRSQILHTTKMLTILLRLNRRKMIIATSSKASSLSGRLIALILKIWRKAAMVRLTGA